MTPYESLTNRLIELRAEVKRLAKIWKQANPADDKIEGWNDDENTSD